MGMTKGHGTAAVIIGTLQLLVAGGLIVASFVFMSYGSMSTVQTPYWGGFPVSIQTPLFRSRLRDFSLVQANV